MKSENHGKCEGCFYFKPRDAELESGQLAWGPFCLRNGQPVKCEIAITECEIERIKNADFDG
jgi:hypothetical protein